MVMRTIRFSFSRGRSAREVGRRHDARLRRVKNLNTAYSRASVYLDRWVQENFKTEGGKVGGWKAFSPNTRRAQLDPSAKLLQDTGHMRASFLPFATRHNAGIGSDLPYSEYHHKGAPANNLPKRRLLPEDDDVRDDVRDIFEGYLEEALR